MPYDEEFFNKYHEYLKEVKDQHIDLLKTILSQIPRLPENIVDLGAGIDGEFKELYKNFSNTHEDEEAFDYYRVDNNAQTLGNDIIKINYRNIDSVASLIRVLKCDCFVSLFSSEITSTYQDNYELYSNIFQNTDVEYGIVAGFYYGKHLDYNTVQVGDITFYQTLEKMCDVKNDIFDEIRIEKYVPSKMFGDNVFEVWKLFRKI